MSAFYCSAEEIRILVGWNCERVRNTGASTLFTICPRTRHNLCGMPRQISLMIFLSSDDISVFFMFVRLLILISHCLFKANIFSIVRLISCLFERNKEKDGGEQTRRQTLSYHTTTHRHAPLHTYTHSHKFSKEKKANVNTHTHISIPANTRKTT